MLILYGEIVQRLILQHWQVDGQMWSLIGTEFEVNRCGRRIGQCLFVLHIAGADSVPSCIAAGRRQMRVVGVGCFGRCAQRLRVDVHVDELLQFRRGIVVAGEREECRAERTASKWAEAVYRLRFDGFGALHHTGRDARLPRSATERKFEEKIYNKLAI